MSPSPPSSPSSPSASTDNLLPLSSSAATTALLAPTLASPSPITALPAPNSSPFLNLNPNSNSTPPNPTARRFPPPCWTNEETLALIQSYRDKWFSLRRTNLRAAHWDDVAADVAQRSLHLPTSTPKSSVQCRHKIEKLRKRYRAERKRSLAHDPTAPPSSPWIFFSHMESMENPNPNPNSIPTAIPTAIPRYQEDLDEYGDEIDAATFYRRPPVVVANGGGGGGGGGLKFKIPKAVRSASRAIPIGNSSSSFGSEFDREMRRRMEVKRMRGRGGGEDEYEESGQGESTTTAAAMGEMVRALRVLGDGYMRMEQMKMETAREMERSRMEMELKRTEMILDSQMRIVDSFVKGFMGEKKVKRSAPDS